MSTSDSEILGGWLEKMSAAREQGRPCDRDELCCSRPDLRPKFDELADGHDFIQAHLQAQRITLNLAPGVQPIDGYRLVELLGEGGFGEVWKAERSGGFLVALKFISLQRPAGQTEKAALELVKNLRHGNLLTISASWVLGSTLVIETELADQSLHQRWQACRDQGLNGIPEQELLEYLAPIADALDYLHKQNIIHHDIKPKNILIKGGKPLLADFGLMQVLDAPASPWATRSFAAPEVAQGESNDPRVDQYALAVSFCRLVSGQFPYKVGEKWPDYASLNLSMLPGEQRVLVGKALAEKPEKRWSSCRRFVEDLRTVVGIAHYDFNIQSKDQLEDVAFIVKAAALAIRRPLLSLLTFAFREFVLAAIASGLVIVLYWVIIHIVDADGRFEHYGDGLAMKAFMMLAWCFRLFRCPTSYYLLAPSCVAVLLGVIQLCFGTPHLEEIVVAWLLGLSAMALLLGICRMFRLGPVRHRSTS